MLIDDDLASIVGLPRLRRLLLGQGYDLTPFGAEQLAQLSDLEELNVEVAEPGDRAIQLLSRLRSLQRLRLRVPAATAALWSLVDLPLEHLTIEADSAVNLEWLQGFPMLKELRVESGGAIVGDLRGLARPEGLRRLELFGGPLSDVLLQSLQTLTKLEVLWLEADELDPITITSFGNLKALRVLELGSHIPVNSMRALTALQSLNYFACNSLDAGAVMLALQFPYLERFAVRAQEQIEAELAQVTARLPNLVW